MNNEPDLAARVAALEKLSGHGPRPGRVGSLLRGLGYLLLATLLTLNAWVMWKGFDALDADRIQRHFWVVCHRGATDQQRRDAFTELVKAGNREWRGARLAHLKLRSGEFDGAYLELANMEGCDFTQSTMVGARLRGADLQMAKLVRVDLSLANLAEAFLLKADLTDSTVRRADLRSASLEQCDLKNTNFEGSNLSEANLLLAVLTNANLRKANLSWSNLDAADFHGANLDGTNLENATTRDTCFTDSNWWRAIGLSSETIDRLKQEFAPSSEAPPEFQKDYVKWLQQ
ncbi:MAG: pentapeptide repeat-containing protein [Planctomycetota bacterium]|jgi:uncharacterized protein YjbI with pentapeptide repeats